MSVLIKILKVGLEAMPKGNVELNVGTINEEIKSNKVAPSCSPIVQLAFMVPYTIKRITFSIMEESNDEQGKIVGKMEYFLYSVRQIRQGQKAIKMITLHNQNKEKQVMNSDIASLAGRLVFQISHNSKRRILAEIERVYFNIKDVKTLHMQIQQRKVAQEVQFQQILNITNNQPLQNRSEKRYKECGEKIIQTNRQKKDESEVYEVDTQGYITLRPIKTQNKLEQIMQKINEESIIAKQEEKIPKSLLSEIKDISQIHTSKPIKKAIAHPTQSPPPQQAQKKLQIFQPLPDLHPPHINLNPSSNMFQVYAMCCGEQIDLSHQVQSPPYSY